VWTDCGRVGVEQHCVESLNKNNTALKGKKGTLNSAFRDDKELLRDNSDNTDNFAQAAMFNVTTTFHTTRQEQHRPMNFKQAQASTTSPDAKVHQLHIYNHNNIP